MSSLNIDIVSNADEVIQLISARLEDINIKELTALQASTIMAEMLLIPLYLYVQVVPK